ncbi:cyclic lactone autoinducer peptide [Alkalibaculum bacchi]|nr:cyclic lactone autoinducer peptide [Alkalibaculum bacchi]
MRKKIFSIASMLLTTVAVLFAGSACIWGFYQPEEPKSLSDK